MVPPLLRLLGQGIIRIEMIQERYHVDNRPISSCKHSHFIGGQFSGDLKRNKTIALGMSLDGVNRRLQQQHTSFYNRKLVNSKREL